VPLARPYAAGAPLYCAALIIGFLAKFIPAPGGFAGPLHESNVILRERTDPAMPREEVARFHAERDATREYGAEETARK